MKDAFFVSEGIQQISQISIWWLSTVNHKGITTNFCILKLALSRDFVPQ
jgi:hypothetical protein